MSHYDYEEVSVDSSGFEGLQLKFTVCACLQVRLWEGCAPPTALAIGSSEAADPCPKAPKYPEHSAKSQVVMHNETRLGILTEWSSSQRGVSW